MSSDILQGPEPIEPRRSRGSRVLVGCAGAAIGAVIVIIICVAAFVAWIRSPGVPLQGNRLVDRDTVLYAELNVSPGDAVAMELVSKAVGAQTREQAGDAQEVPAPLRWALGRASGKPLTSDLAKTLPVIVMITRQDAGPGSRPPALLAVSFPKLGNRVRMAGWIASFVAGWSDDEGGFKGEKYKDETILAIRDDDDGGRSGEARGSSGYGYGSSDERDDGTAESGDEGGRDAADEESFGTVFVSIVGSDFLLARGADPLKRAIDRIKTPEPQAASTDPPAVLAGRPEDALLYVAAREGHAAWAIDLLRRASPEFASLLEPLTERAGAFALWARLETPDVLAGEMRIGAGSPGEDEADEYAGSVTSVVGGEEIAFALEPLPRGPGVRHAWRLRVSGLEKAGIRALEHLEEREDERENR